MQTFSSQQQVRSIDEMLESTLYVKAKNVSIERLQAENADLRTKLDIAQEEVRRLLRPDDEIAQYEPVENGFKLGPDAYGRTLSVHDDTVTIASARPIATVRLPDNVRLCRRKEPTT